MSSDTERPLNQTIGVYGALQILVTKLNDSLVLYHARCSREKSFWGSKRNDWVWVRKHSGLDIAPVGILNGGVLGRLDARFKLTSEGIVCRLA